MAIKGSLKEASLPDVLQLLTMGGKSGCLSVTDRQSFGYIYFEEGRIIYASLLNRRDRLGDILVREDVITREQLERAIEEQSRTRDGRRLGEILRDSGVLDDGKLQRYVRHQIEEAVYHLFTWNQGTFYFEPGQRPEREPILVSIDPESLLLEGARRVDEWGQIEKKVQSLDVIFTLDSDKSASLSALDLAPEQEMILPYLDGKHSGWEIIEQTALDEFDVGKALYGLISAGLVRRVGKRERPAPPGESRARLYEHRNLGVAFYKTAMYDESVRELQRVLELEPGALDAEFYLGLIALRKGDNGGAKQKFNAVMQRGSRNPAVYNNLALLEQRLGRKLDARALLKEALEKTEGHAKLFLNLATIQLRLGDPAAALVTLDDFTKMVGDALPALYYSLRLLTEALAGNLEAAAKVAEEGVGRHPYSSALANNAGALYERRGDLKRARAMYETALDQDSGLPQAAKNLGDLCYREGGYDQAAEMYERAVRANAGLGDDIYAKLGNIYYKGRERRKAMQMWERALEINPGNDVVRTNLEFVQGASSEQ